MICQENFMKMPKIARLSREIVITEKIDGTNGQIYINGDGELFTGSKNIWITPQNDNYGFAKWCQDNKEELLKLGVGHHYGEWWGQGIQRKYGLTEKRFSLFNSFRWADNTIRPKCCHVVPTLFQGSFHSYYITTALEKLRLNGSLAAPMFMRPEGIIIYHTAARMYFKKTLLNDDKPKTLVL